jgi:CBS domain-containing protein
MMRHKINRLPVVDEAGKLIGIVTRGDIIKGIAEGS